MNSTETIFLGTLVPAHMQSEVYEKNINAAQDAGTAFQYKIIRGLDENMTVPVSICNLLPVSSYPRHYKDAVIRRSEWSHATQAHDINVGFLNFAYIKRLVLSSAYCNQLHQVIAPMKGLKTAICYSTNGALLDGLCVIKRFNPAIKTCLIIPDMPEFNDMSDDKSLLYKWFIKRSSRKLRAMYKYIDSFVFMTEQSAQYLNTGKPYAVVEGIADTETCNVENTPTDTKTIMYTGTTNRQFGVPSLVEAFSMIEDSDYRLVICGCGDFDAELREHAKKDSRIQFMGIVPHDKVLELQKSATVLVNPRKNLGEYTKYSFPSKTMEYLVSGVPVVAYKLDGIPDEYDDYIRYVPDNSIETFTKTLIKACENQRRKQGISAREFVLMNKNAKAQCRRIIELLELV